MVAARARLLLRQRVDRRVVLAAAGGRPSRHRRPPRPSQAARRHRDHPVRRRSPGGRCRAAAPRPRAGPLPRLDRPHRAGQQHPDARRGLLAPCPRRAARGARHAEGRQPVPSRRGGGRLAGGAVPRRHLRARAGPGPAGPRAGLSPRPHGGRHQPVAGRGALGRQRRGRPRQPVQPGHGRGRAVLFLGSGQLRGGHRARALRRGRGRGGPRGGAGARRAVPLGRRAGLLRGRAAPCRRLPAGTGPRGARHRGRARAAPAGPRW